MIKVLLDQYVYSVSLCAMFNSGKCKGWIIKNDV